jgi:hypothetical protein
MAPPHNKKHLHTEQDYENMEFRSAINAWSPEPKFGSDFDKVKLSDDQSLLNNKLKHYNMIFTTSNK